MPLLEKSFDQLVNDQVNSMQAVAGQLLNFSTGSVFQAFVESNAGNSIWLQSIFAYLLGVTRLQTSTGVNVDTFVRQFGLFRVPATPAYGPVTFSRSSATQDAVIESGTLEAGTFNLVTQGALVYSPSNQITYSVYNDSANIYYNPTLNAYVIPAGTFSASIPVVAVTAGAIGNVLANQINTISTPISYVDTVTNPSSFANGQNAESDSALKTRFVLYLNSLSKATEQSIDETVQSVPGVARYDTVENEDILGNPYIGFFYVVVDDGTGGASPELLGNVQAAVYADRGLTIAFSIYAAIAYPIDITVHVYTDHSVPDSTIQASVQTALSNYLFSQGFSATYAWSDIARVVYEVNNTFVNPQTLSPINNVKNWTQNGSTNDITLVGRNISVPGVITVLVNV